jgi:Na+/H+ antiporter NhaC
VLQWLTANVDGLLSLMPIIVAITLALWTRKIIPALGTAVLLAALILQGGNPIGMITDAVRLVWAAIANKDHLVVSFFTLSVAATIEILNEGRGTHALVNIVTRRAKTHRSGQLATWGAGMVVFFDDYANCLIVGGSMKAVTDRLRISREKLAYLVDSTAAPMATLALVSTWIGFEVGLIGDALANEGIETNAYSFFLEGLGYRFYPFMALVFAFCIAAMGRDFGPMYRAEKAAQLGSGSEPEHTETLPPGRAWLGGIPIAALVLVTGASLGIQGSASSEPGAELFEIIGAADGYQAMVHGALAALSLAAVLSVGMGALVPSAMLGAAAKGVRAILPAFAVLFLAWALGNAIDELQAKEFIKGLVIDDHGQSVVPLWSFPTIIFMMAAAIAFSTGTSFGTMTVLIPLAIPVAYALETQGISGEVVLDPHSQLAIATTSSVLAGATFGDHCSPISDTTVLSSTGADCDHAAHVATQLPYALTAGLISILFGTLPAGFGVSPWVLLPLGAAACFGVIWLLGRPVQTPTSSASSRPTGTDPSSRPRQP